MATKEVRVRPEQRLPELERDARAAQLFRRDDWALGQLVTGTVVVGHDDLQPELARPANLVDRGDPAVDRQDETAALVGEAFERVAADAVALVEPARQMPLHVGAELSQDEHREHRRADAVDVVVAVHADALAVRDRGADPVDRGAHVSDQQRVVQRLLAGEKRPRRFGVAVSAPDEHACRDLAEAERLGEGVGLPVRARTDRPGALRHRRLR
jgi:hypothetical protein